MGKRILRKRPPVFFNDFFKEWASEEHETHVHTRDGLDGCMGKRPIMKLRLYVLLNTGFAGKLC